MEDAFDSRLYKAMADRDLNALMTILNDLRSIEMDLAPVPSRLQGRCKRGPLENAPRGSETETPPPAIEEKIE